MGYLNPNIAGIDLGGWKVLAKSDGITSLAPGDTATHIIQLVTIPGGMLQKNSQIRVLGRWDADSGNTGNNSVYCFIGGKLIYPQFTAGGGWLAPNRMLNTFHHMGNNNSLTAQWESPLGQYPIYNSVDNTYSNSGNWSTNDTDFTSDVNVEYRYILSDAGNTIRLINWYVEVLI